jgi:23S rRNA (uracil1939-C5)-methyltransferase
MNERNNKRKDEEQVLGKGQRVLVRIEDIGAQGQGIGRFEGLVVFVSGTFPGDEARVQITDVRKNYATAELESIVSPSAARTEVLCPHAAVCGGCAFQGWSCDAQLAHKEEMVREALRRIGGIGDPPVQPILGMEHPFEYRNKAQFAVQKDVVGFYAPKSRDAFSVTSCMLQKPPAVALARAFSSFLQEYPKNIYRHLIVRTATTGEVMAILVANKDDVAHVETLAGRLDDAVADPWSLESLILNVNKEAHRRALGPENRTLAGAPVIRDALQTKHATLALEVSPASFYQVNPEQASRLYEQVFEYAGLTGGETVLDLYCGAGSIGLSLAGYAGRVIGVESVRAAVLDANRNAVLNGIVNAEFIYGKAEEVVPKRLSGLRADVVILDPPRQGCAPGLLSAVSELQPERIVYVSCNPSTLARDVSLLAEQGYTMNEAQPVDMFPWTAHVEAVVLMSRAKE